MGYLDNAASFFNQLTKFSASELDRYLYCYGLLESWENDIRHRQKELPLNRLYSNLYIRDPQTQFVWATNRVFARYFDGVQITKNEMGEKNPGGKIKLFALQGPQNGRHVERFMRDVCDLDGKNESNIAYVVCLGHPHDDTQLSERDFFDYFSTSEVFGAFDDHDEGIFSIKSSRDEEASAEGVNYYNLTVECRLPEKEKKITVIHIPTDDMTSTELNSGTRTAFAMLLQALNRGEGVAVHCQAGLGRTGHWIGALLLCLTRRFEHIFEDNEPKAICFRLAKFVNELRACRPGLILTLDQLVKSLEFALIHLKYGPPLTPKEQSPHNEAQTNFFSSPHKASQELADEEEDFEAFHKRLFGW